MRRKNGYIEEKIQVEKQRDGRGGGARDQPGYGSKEFQSLLSPRSFSNLRAVVLNSCKYLSNVRLTGVRVYEGEKWRKRGKRQEK